MTKEYKNVIEIRGLKDKLKSVTEERDKYKHILEKIQLYYGNNFLENSENFDGKNILHHYLDNVFGLNDRSKRLKKDLKLTDESIKDPPLYMNHILYHFMRHDITKLATILDYELKDNPKNLEDSYTRSASLAENLNNHRNSLTWYINLKTPVTYIDSQSVVKNQKSIFRILEDKSLVDARRIHLFYEKFLTCHEILRKKEMMTLLTTLLLEFLHGIESKVLYVKDFETFSKELYKINENNSDASLFILDFALYYSYEENEEKYILTNDHISKMAEIGCPVDTINRAKQIKNKIFRGKEDFMNILKKQICDDTQLEMIPKILNMAKYNNGDFMNGTTHVLCSDFTAEIPNFNQLNKIVNGGLNQEEQDDMTKKYEQDKVYDFDNPIIYPIYKNYFLSLWNKNEYCVFLKKLIENHKKKCNCSKNNCAFEEINKAKSAFHENVEMYDFIDFWSICKNNFGTEDLIDISLFEQQYFFERDDVRGLEREFVKIMITQIMKTFKLNMGKEETWKKLDDIMSSFQLRKMHKFHSNTE